MRRYIQQSSGLFLEAKGALADESSPLAVNASPLIAGYAQMYAPLEQKVLESLIEGVALHTDSSMGPSTWYSPDGGAADEGLSGIQTSLYCLRKALLTASESDVVGLPMSPLRKCLCGEVEGETQ